MHVTAFIFALQSASGNRGTSGAEIIIPVNVAKLKYVAVESGIQNGLGFLANGEVAANPLKMLSKV